MFTSVPTAVSRLFGQGTFGAGTFGFLLSDPATFDGRTPRGPGRPEFHLSGLGPFDLDTTDAEIAREVWVRSGQLVES